MNKKISLGVCISLIVIACTVTFVVTWTVSLNVYNATLPGVGQRDEISSKLQEIDSFIRNNFRGEINEADISYGIFAGYIAGLGDRHTVYLTAEQHRQHLSEERGRIITTGIRAERESSGYLTVSDVYTGSSADLAEIIRGDTIISVNERNVHDIGAETALRMLEGDVSTGVNITIQRDGELLPFSLIRNELDIISVEADVVNEIGIMRITTFNELTAAQFNSALQMFAGADAGALLIDLRDNSSGFYTPVSAMSNSLIDAGTIAQTENRGNVVRDFITTDSSHAFPEEMRNIPLVVLVNSQTSGAGELFAALLQAHAGAQIIGTSTAGNTYLQHTQGLKDGSAIRVTVARIMLTNAPDYSGTGLTIDVNEEMETPVSYVISELRDRELHEIHDDQIRRALLEIHTRLAH
jgi:carboxyl-terminal processing protease